MRLSTLSLLQDILVENFANLVCALLRVPLLSALVVDIGDTESGRVALGPFEVAEELLALLYVQSRDAYETRNIRGERADRSDPNPTERRQRVVQTQERSGGAYPKVLHRIFRI
jgi:hypothetical protein